MPVTAIISGINGFIGSHLCSSVKDKGYNIIGLVQDTPKNRETSFDYKVRYIDLARPDTLNDALKNGDVFFHLAGIPREQHNFTKAEYDDINTHATEILLNEAIRSGIKRFVYISTIEAAGPARNGVPLTEDMEPRPINDYGKSKLAAENIVLKMNGRGIETTVVRLPMIYGPGNYMTVPKLFKAVKRPFFPIIGNGRAKMEFCFVGNAVQGIVLAGEHENAKGELFFISDGSKTIQDVIQAVAEAVGKKPFLLHIPVSWAYGIAFGVEGLARLFPFPPFRMPATHKPYFSRMTVAWTSRSVNICAYGKAERLLGYKPTFDLFKGLEISVNDFRERGWI